MDKVFAAFVIFVGACLLVMGILCLAALPLWFLWTHCGLGETYFYFLPKVWQSIPFWDCLGLMLVIGMIKQIILPFKIPNKTKE